MNFPSKKISDGVFEGVELSEPIVGITIRFMMTTIVLMLKIN